LIYFGPPFSGPAFSVNPHHRRRRRRRRYCRGRHHYFELWRIAA